MTDTEALSCQELVELVTDYLEGALRLPICSGSSTTSQAAIDCTRYLEQLRMTIRLTGTLTSETSRSRGRGGAARRLPRLVDAP